MMPFSERFQSYYDAVFGSAVREVGLLPVKVDEIYTPTQISQDIYRLIESSVAILADVTGKNPNVNYELGIAHALGKRPVIITQNKDDVPFDYRHYRYIAYDTSFAGWEERLRKQIVASLRSTLRMNSPTTNISGTDLEKLFRFLTDTALDFSYEISKSSEFHSDSSGSCAIKQQWSITARTDMTHILHGVVCDVPGAIRLEPIYDRTNGAYLNTFTSIGTDTHVRYIILLHKLLKAGETVSFDLNFSAEGYLAELFRKGRETIFQRPNGRRGVYYKYRKDVYILPATDITQNLTVCFPDPLSYGKSQVLQSLDSVRLEVEIDWPEPTAQAYNYEICPK